MPSTKDAITFRMSKTEAKFVEEIALNLGIPKSRVMAVALRYFEKLLEEQRKGTPDEPLQDSLIRLANR